MMSATITEKGILFRINQTFNPAMDALALYEATRGAWVLGIRRKEARYAFSVHKKKILEVYQIEQWLPAGTTEYKTRDSKKFDKSRWEFVGRIAEEAVRKKYVGRFIVSDKLRGPSPTIYTWPSPIDLLEIEPL